MTTPDNSGARRDCEHPRARHRHGTRAAYVADRCRCQDCREANRAEAAARRRAIAYGRWQPYVDADPARQHITRLRATGVGINHIVALSGVGSGTIRQLVYGHPRTGRPVTRVRAQTAAAVLAVPLGRPAPGALVPTTSVRGLLTDLHDAGYSTGEVAALLGRTTTSLTASLSRHRITAATAAAITDLHRTLTDQQARRPHTDPHEPDQDHLSLGEEGDEIDEVAVERAMAGERIALTAAEQAEAIRRLADAGLSDRRIALLLGTSARTVARRKKSTAA